MTQTFDTLYALSSKDKVKQWSIEAIDNGDGTATLRKKYGYYEQKITTADKIIKNGKNIGKSNETTPYTQAVAEAKAGWILKQDQNYITTIPTEDTVLKVQKPMLAHKFVDREKDIIYPCYAGLKANGTRDTAIWNDDKIQQTKRGGKPWEYFGHLDSYLEEFMPKDMKFDGEAFNPEYTFQQITRMVNKDKPENKEIQLWLFDIITPQPMHFKDRLALLDSLVPDNHPFLIKIPYVIINNREELMAFYESVISGEYDGYKHEGIVVRNMEGEYVENQRSCNLQKLKPLKHAEFKIVDGKSDKGEKRKGCCTFICETEPGGPTFSITPVGTLDEKKEYLTNLPNYIGKYITGEFEDYSESGKPLKVVGLGIREVDANGEPSE